MYKGVLSETRVATDAVLETSGQTLLAKGEPFQIWYHASCGGRLQESARFDKKNTPPGAPASPWPSYNNDQNSFLEISPAELLEYFEQAAFMPDQGEWCFEQAPRFAWIRLVTAEELERKARMIDPKFKRLNKINFLERGPDGRITAIELKGGKKSRLISEDFPLRQALAPGSLRSSLFSVMPIRFNGKQRYFLFFGRGYGHGRGACQVGVLRQGREQISHKDILRWYYPDAALTRNQPGDSEPK